MINNLKKSWTVEEINHKWYFYDSQGEISEPYDSKELASNALEDYETYVYNRDFD